MNKIYVKWCLAGHTTCRYHPIHQDKCPDCDGDFYEKCRRCGRPLPFEAVDPGYAHGNIRPDTSPARPERCSRCGTAYPWSRNRRRPLRLAARYWLLKTGIIRET